jgi:hypothetical protein
VKSKMQKRQAVKKHLATCYICGDSMQDDKLIMFNHLLTYHPADLVTSESFQSLLKNVLNGAFSFGSGLNRMLRGGS